VICTDIAKDGMLQGSSADLYKRILDRFPSVHLIASGGVDGMQDLLNLRQTGLYGAIVGKAIYEGRVDAAQLAALDAEVF
jgi:phosphoribosylformimino-5-aminoimidazole carboxamide ribotide isomerase